MSEFAEIPIGVHLKLTSGFPFASSQFSNEGFPLIRIRDVLSSRTETYYQGSFPPGYVIKKGDILVGMDGDFHVVRWNGPDALLNQRVLRVNVHDESVVVLDYLFHWLGPYVQKVNDITAATTVKHLSTKDLTKARASLPPPPVQRRIANILSTIETAIEQTEALIEKYQHIKAGLMHDLFTRGVLPNGQLRPPREQEPELYQETAIGWIPREWKSVTLSSIANLIVGFAFKSEWFVADGINLLRGENVGYGSPDWQDRQCLNASKQNLFTEYLLNPGDVVIGMDRTFTKSGVKITQLAATDCPALLVQRVGKFVAIDCDTDFLRWLVVSSGYLRSLFNQQKGMDIPHLSKSEILAPVVPLPNRDEQGFIASQVQGIADLIKVTSAHLQKLRQQKLGLMQDLLTGKVPVTADTPPSEAAA